MKIFKTDEEAVSPVIGVILMVAIVVILAAVIAAFVFGMTGSVQSTKTVGVVVNMNDTGIGVIVWQGGADINKIQYWNATVAGVIDANGTRPKVGDVNYTLTPITNDRVIISATFDDGASQVVYDKQF